MMQLHTSPDGGQTITPVPGDASGNLSVTIAPASLSTFLPTSGSIVAGNIKAAAGKLFGVSAVNQVAAVTYLQFFNTAGVPALGTNVVFSIPIPAGSGSVLTIPPSVFALASFSTGIAWGAATTATGASAPASAPTGMCFYA
jgi:hypothetical protein